MTYSADQPRDWHGRWTDGADVPPPPPRPFAATMHDWARYFDEMDHRERYRQYLLAFGGETGPNEYTSGGQGRILLAGDPPTGGMARPGQAGSSSADPASRPFDKDKFADTLRENAYDQSNEACAANLREAFEAAGGDSTGHPKPAKDWGPTLQKNGFVPVDPNGYHPQTGDVVVIQPYPGGNTAGHIAGYDGNNWTSDFIQRDMWGGHGYRSYRPPYVIYRHP